MKLRNEPDELLMSQVQKGERRPLEMLVRRYANPLLTFINRMTNNPHNSEDVFQEVFLAVWAKRNLYKYPRPFRPWLYTIAINKCRQAYRKASAASAPVVVEPSTFDLRESGSDSPLDTAIATETEQIVQQAVMDLPPQQRIVFVMRVFNGLNYGQIAEAVGKQPATARSLMHYALASVRRALDPQLNQDQ